MVGRIQGQAAGWTDDPSMCLMPDVRDRTPRCRREVIVHSTSFAVSPGVRPHVVALLANVSLCLWCLASLHHTIRRRLPRYPGGACARLISRIADWRVGGLQLRGPSPWACEATRSSLKNETAWRCYIVVPGAVRRTGTARTAPRGTRNPGGKGPRRRRDISSNAVGTVSTAHWLGCLKVVDVVSTLGRPNFICSF